MLSAIRIAHAQLPDTGQGWYLVCRPAKPALPVELEQSITGATLVTDMDLVAKELTELRIVEGELDIDDPVVSRTPRRSLCCPGSYARPLRTTAASPTPASTCRWLTTIWSPTAPPGKGPSWMPGART